MPRIRKSRTTTREWFEQDHRFEHWYRDNQVYFITARCRDRQPALAEERAKLIFWEQFAKYSEQFGFTPWITSLLDNHYHTLGYVKLGEDLPRMMQRLHGAVAKLVNDTLAARVVPFWTDSGKQYYFDGCIRDEVQCRRAYRYVLTQCRRHGVCDHPARYEHTRVRVELERGVARGAEPEAFLRGVPYARYERGRQRPKRGRNR